MLASLIAHVVVTAPPGMSVTLRVDGRQDAPYVRFVSEQIEQRWGVVVERGAASPGGFLVHLEELVGGQIAVRISHAGELLTDRAVDAAVPVQAQLDLWLVVRSTIERGLKQAELRAAAERLGAAAAPAQASASPGAAEPSARATLPAEPAAADAAPFSRTKGLLGTLWLETPKLLAAGISAMVGLEGRRLLLGGSLGYRHTPAPAGLAVHAIPLNVSIAVKSSGRAASAALGLLGGAELKVPVSDERAALAWGVEGGPFAQARIGIDDRAGVLIRFAVAWRLVRNRYLFDGGRAAEHPWAATVGTGIEWQ